MMNLNVRYVINFASLDSQLVFNSISKAGYENIHSTAELPDRRF